MVHNNNKYDIMIIKVLNHTLTSVYGILDLRQTNDRNLLVTCSPNLFIKALFAYGTDT